MRHELAPDGQNSPFTARGLYRGCLLATIAHAFATLRYPEVAHEHAWDGHNYNVSNSSGAFGTVTFGSGVVVGVFFDVNSSAAGVAATTPGGWYQFFEAAPDEVITLAKEEALQYMLQDIEGSPQPAVTSAFWSDRDALVPARPWDVTLADGAHLVHLQLSDTAAAIPEWQKLLGLSHDDIALVQSLLERRLLVGEGRITLSQKERDLLRPSGPEALDACRDVLLGIGVEID